MDSLLTSETNGSESVENSSWIGNDSGPPSTEITATVVAGVSDRQVNRTTPAASGLAATSSGAGCSCAAAVCRTELDVEVVPSGGFGPGFPNQKSSRPTMAARLAATAATGSSHRGRGRPGPESGVLEGSGNILADSGSSTDVSARPIPVGTSTNPYSSGAIGGVPSVLGAVVCKIASSRSATTNAELGRSSGRLARQLITRFRNRSSPTRCICEIAPLRMRSVRPPVPPSLSVPNGGWPSMAANKRAPKL